MEKAHQTKPKDWRTQIIGKKITGFEYGPDADGDPHVYFIELENGVKIGISKVTEDGKIIHADRTERFPDGTILRFCFHGIEIEPKEEG